MSYLSIDQLQEQLTVEQVAQFYGVPLPEMKAAGNEMRCQCFLNCGKTEETGDRAIALQVEHPAKLWKCHQYGCNKGGNLVGIAHMMKSGYDGTDRPRGQRFKDIAADFRSMVGGVVQSTTAATVEPRPTPPRQAEPETNTPLKDSSNEAAQKLTTLDEMFVDIDTMTPKAASYFRRRLWLTADVAAKWRMGYLPTGTKGNRQGGTMRGKVVYPIINEAGDVLTWFGRDPDYEDEKAKWIAAHKEGKEPIKTRFVKGFKRGLELFGQHIDWQEAEDTLKRSGLVVVEGPNDVIRLDTLGQPSVGLCSNEMTDEQAAKIARLAGKHASNRATILLDADTAGDTGAKAAVWKLAEQGLDVHLAWSKAMHDGKYADRQPESLEGDEWEAIASTFMKP